MEKNPNSQYNLEERTAKELYLIFNKIYQKVS